MPWHALLIVVARWEVSGAEARFKQNLTGGRPVVAAVSTLNATQPGVRAQRSAMAARARVPMSWHGTMLELAAATSCWLTNLYPLGAVGQPPAVAGGGRFCVEVLCWRRAAGGGRWLWLGPGPGTGKAAQRGAPGSVLMTHSAL